MVCIQSDRAEALPGIEAIQVDLTRPEDLAAIPRKWDAVIHLAGASVPSQFVSMEPVSRNVAMTLNLLAHLEKAKVLLVSSCHVYAPSAHPHSETDPIRPQGRYGLSKHLLEQMAAHFGQGLDIRIARPFNHLGPGQRDELVIPSLLRRMQECTGHSGRVITMQGTDSVRDFVDVRDVVPAYLAILDLDAPSVKCFNVCSGRPHRISDLVKVAKGLMGLDCDVQFKDMPNSADDNPYVVGNPDCLTRATGWRASISLEDSIKAMISTLG